MASSTVNSLQQGSLLKRFRPMESQTSSGASLWKSFAPINAQRPGYCTPFRLPVTKMFNDLKTTSQSSSSASIHNLVAIENQLLCNHRSSIKPCNYSTTPEEFENAVTPGQGDQPVRNGFIRKLEAFHAFCRTYALVGTVFGVVSVSLLPLESLAEITPSYVVGVLLAAICMVLINLYTVGINQLYDVELDKINKPYLPLASEEMSMRTGTAIVVIATCMSLGLAWILQSPPLLCTVLTFFFIGGAYSADLPFLRWKSNAFLAAFALTAMRGFALPVGIFMHIQKYVLGKPIVFTKSVIFATAYMCIIMVIITIFKDIPDLEGDRAFGMKNLAILIGKEKVFSISIYTMMMLYAAAVVLGASSTILFNKIVTIVGHSALGLLVWWRARSVDLSDDKSTLSYYMLIWNLLYTEYLLIPFV